MYQTTPMRWVVLLSIALIFFVQGMMISALAPVAVQIARAYELSTTMGVNMCAMSFALLSPPADFLAVYLFNNYRVDHVLRLVTILSFSGAMFRFLATSIDEFWPILVGTIIAACVSSIFLNSPMIIANRWFNDKERALAMALLIVC